MRNLYLKGFALTVTLFGILTIMEGEATQAQTSFGLGVSYFGAIGDMSGANVTKDLNLLAERQYTVIRVWATWNLPDKTTASLVCSNGSLNPNALTPLRSLLDAANSRNINIDLTFSYGVFRDPNNFNCSIDCAHQECGTFNKYKAGIANATIALSAYSNVLFDVCNECQNSGLDRGQMADLIDTVKRNHPGRQVTISFSGGNPTDPNTGAINANYYNRLKPFLDTLGRRPDYLAPHFMRDCSSAWANNTGSRLNTFRNTLEVSYQSIPIYLQEENRRDYTDDGCDDGDSHPPLTFGPIGNGYEVSEADFDTASFQAKNNGSNSARFWNLHNEAGFNLSTSTMCSQFDSVERSTLSTLACHRLGRCLGTINCNSY